MFAMFKNFMNSQLIAYFFVLEPLWNSDYQKLSNFRIDFFYRSAISPFAVKLFLLPFTSQCSMQNIGLATPVTSSNLRNQALLFTDLRLLQGTSFNSNSNSCLVKWYNFLLNFYWRTEFLLCTMITIDC